MGLLKRWGVHLAVGAVAAAVALALAAATGPGAPAGAEVGGGTAAGEPRPLITVTGAGLGGADPDTGRLVVGSWAERPTAKEAQAESARVMEAVVSRLRSLGVAEDQMETVRVSLHPQMDYSERGDPPRVRGFRAENVISVTTPRVDQVGHLLDAAVAAGANLVEGVGFTVKDDGALRLKAIELAVKDARAKAEAAARAAGVQVKGVASITVGEPSAGPVFRAARAMEEAVSTPVVPGQVEIRATVTVSFEF